MSVSVLRQSKASSTTHAYRASLAIFPILSAVLPLSQASAEVIPANNDTETVVNESGNQFNITHGTVGGNNLFHSFEQFDIETGQTANFITVPDIQNVISTVNSTQASVIDGTVQVSGSNANLFLMNPAGILLGPNTQLNLSGSFNATTATGIEFGEEELSLNRNNNYATLAGEPSAFRFDNHQAGAVVNLGDLSVNEGEAITLIGGTVINTGQLNAPAGTITLAAIEGGKTVRINQNEQLLSLEVEATDALLAGEQSITPTSIGEMLVGGSLNHGNQLITNPDGTVSILGRETPISEASAEVITHGSISATGNLGGNINILGNQVSLHDATLDASGTQGGGLIRVGGDYQGEGRVINASQTLVDNQSSLLADAVETGNGGTVIVWADDITQYDGHLSARGGEHSGNGGFAEISGKKGLSVTGSVDLRADKGEFGTVLFDPTNITITDETPGSSSNTLFLSSTAVEDFSLFGDVVLEASNNIVIEPILDGALSFARGRSVTFKADANNLLGGEFRMDRATDIIEVAEGNISIFGAGITVGKLSIDPGYNDNEANNPAIGNVVLESSEWLSAAEIISERGNVSLLGNSIDVDIINTSSDDHNNGGQTINGRSRIAAGNVVLDSNLSVTVGEILTYGFLSDDSHHSPDGGDVTINAANGGITIERTIETFSRVEGREAGSGGDITLTAQDNIFVNTQGVSGTSLNASSTAKTNDSGDGGDIFLNALNGIIDITGQIETSAEAGDGNGDSANSPAGNGGRIELTAHGDITTDNILSQSIADIDGSTQDGDNAGSGGDIVINSTNGNATLGSISAYSSAYGSNALGGGSVEITANHVDVADIDTSTRANSSAQNSGDITINAQNSVVVDGELESYSYARAGSVARNGGDIEIVGNRITTQRIEAWSAAENDDSGRGGSVTLAQRNAANGNFISVNGSIETYSFVGDDDASDGGNVSIDVGRNVEADLNTAVTITGRVETASKARDNDSGNGGSIEIYGDVIDVQTLDSQSQSNQNAGNGGLVSLEGDRSISVGNILASSADQINGEILLTGDSISLIGNRITGDLIRFSPFTDSQDINVGLDGATNALNINESELNQIENRIEFGRLDRSGTGTITLSDSVIATPEDIDILGGDRLIGANLSTGELTYILEGPGDGSIAGTNIRFFDIENIEGGTGNDIFQPNAGTNPNDFTSISGGGGFNTLTYETFSSSPFTVDLSRLELNDIQRLVGSTATEGTLKGANDSNVWTINAQGEGILNGSTAFENFNNIVGGSSQDTLDYSSYASAVSVNIDGPSIGLDSFSSIENIIGSSFSTDRLIGSDNDDLFIIDTTSSINGIEVSGFENLEGGNGDNTFQVEQVIPGINLVGGSDLGNSQSNNRVIFNGETSSWNITDKNQGTLAQAGNITNFHEIQHIESGEQGGNVGIGEMTVEFSQTSSQITGSINSGNSNLTLIGDAINLGHADGVGDYKNASVSGSGTLSIRPKTDGIAIELGGSDSFNSEVLNITDGELTAIQDGFIEIIIGDSNLTEGISLGGNVSFEDSVSLISQETIDTTEGTLLVDGGDLTLTSGDSVLSSNLEILGGDIEVNSRNNISFGDVSTVGSSGSGDIALAAGTGTITTGKLTTSANNESSNAGSVSLSSPGSIEIEFIEAEGKGPDKRGRRVDIETSASFTATGSGRSISTLGANSGEGSIRITFGDANIEAESFSVNNRNSSNGTAGVIETSQALLNTGEFTDNYIQADIEIINRGRMPSPRTPETPTAEGRDVEELPGSESPTSAVETPTAPRQVSSFSTLLEMPTVVGTPSLTSGDDKNIFNVIETSIGQEFSQYFALDDTNKQTATLRQAQEKLQEVEQTSDIAPALVYVYFVPDAASESSVVQEERTVRDDDQLEVMLITQTGTPTRHRQWGVTRAQVNEASRTLRQQTTSQFSARQQYLAPAQQLYDWIMAPVAEALEQQNVQSLGFVMDTGLRTMPLAALHDGDRYLVENYSVGILPTFSLTDFDNRREQEKDLRDSAVLAMGASEFEDQPDLPAVDEEVALIADQLWEGDAFLNEDFVLKNLQAQITAEDYGIVHLATHANFKSDDLDNSYIQMWDERLALSEVSQLGLSNADIGLIILSACNTAVGDHNSEYGFAGFAVNTGSSSALASLWPVNDEGTLGFMSQFYEGLRQSPIRAEALRQAQLKLISGEVGIDYGEVYGPNGETIVTIPELAESGQWDFSHPFYWSAFTMIGNPW